MWLVHVVVGAGLALLWMASMVGKQTAPLGWLFGWTGLFSFAYGMYLRSRPNVPHVGLRTLLFGIAVLALAAASFGTESPGWLSGSALVAGVVLMTTAVIAGMRSFGEPRLT